MPALRWAKSGLQDVEKIEDYSAVMVKRERIDGELRDPEYAYAKVRHRPLSVYLRFLKPENLAGREENEPLAGYAGKLKQALIDTVAQGTITGDLRGKTTNPEAETIVDLYGFLDAIEANIAP